MTQSQVRFAALLALRDSLGIFVATVLMIPGVALIHRIFDGTWYVNWRLMLFISGVLTALFFAFLFISQVLEFSTSERRERNRQPVFPAAMWLRGVYLAGIVMGIALMVGTYKEGDPWWDVVFPVAFVFLGFFAWPRAIKITESEIRQHRILLGFKKIRFGEIERVVCDARRNQTVIFATNGQRITHSMMHVDRERFIRQVEALTGKSAYFVGDLGQSSPAK